MNVETARYINKEIHTYALEALEKYIHDRLDSIHKNLETAKGDDLYILQGSCAELRRLSKIRDYAINVLENEKNGKRSS